MPTYDPYQNYDEEIQPRNEFDIDYDADDLVQDQFGFDFDRSDDVIEDGFGTDDLFFNAETKINGQPSQRNSDDYSGKSFEIMMKNKSIFLFVNCNLF